MARRPTIADLARSAGVSVATVDRVLNGRHPVRRETAQRVYEAATELRFHATGLIRRRLAEDMPQVRVGFLLQKPRQAFYQAFERELRAAAAGAQGVRAVAGVGPGPESSVSKLVGVRQRQDSSELVLDLLGEAALLGGADATAAWQEALLTHCLSIAGGTTQILRNVAAERILGLPR